jgi:hypothetical protein
LRGSARNQKDECLQNKKHEACNSSGFQRLHDVTRWAGLRVASLRRGASVRWRGLGGLREGSAAVHRGGSITRAALEGAIVMLSVRGKPKIGANRWPSIDIAPARNQRRS